MEKLKQKLDELGYKYTVSNSGDELLTGRPYQPARGPLAGIGVTLTTTGNKDKDVYIFRAMSLRMTEDGHMKMLRSNDPSVSENAHTAAFAGGDKHWMVFLLPDSEAAAIGIVGLVTLDELPKFLDDVAGLMASYSWIFKDEDKKESENE